MELKPIFPVSQNINQTSYYWFEYGFTSDEVDKINNDAKKYAFQKAQIKHLCSQELQPLTKKQFQSIAEKLLKRNYPK